MILYRPILTALFKTIRHYTDSGLLSPGKFFVLVEFGPNVTENSLLFFRSNLPSTRPRWTGVRARRPPAAADAVRDSMTLRRRRRVRRRSIGFLRRSRPQPARPNSQSLTTYSPRSLGGAIHV